VSYDTSKDMDLSSLFLMQVGLHKIVQALPIREDPLGLMPVQILFSIWTKRWDLMWSKCVQKQVK
jgi:hypothetical protein